MAQTDHPIALGSETVARLIARQFPELEDRALVRVEAKGTDNHIFRIGEDLCARFPKVPWAAATAKREAHALPRFSEAPLTVPKVYGVGSPGEAFPHAWSVLSWLPGTPLEDSALADPIETAQQLCEFFNSVRRVPVDSAFAYGPDNNRRGAPLATRDPEFREALACLPRVDADWANRLWAQALAARPAREDVWLHGDVHPGNVLIEDGHISGVIDWGLCGVGDGACDLLTAWAMFDRHAREVFRRSMSARDEDWLRGAGWALSMAVIYLPYAYENGLRSDMSERMIARLMEDFV